MKLEYQHLLPADFHPHSKVWIYQGSRLFSLGEALQLEEELDAFVADWKSHGTPVKGFATLFFGQFLVFMADETATEVSGCSTDSSVRFVKKVEQDYQTDIFNRQMLAFVIKDKVQLLPLSQLNYAAENGFISNDTLYFNNTVLTKQALESNWLIPLQQSWLAARLKLPAL